MNDRSKAIEDAARAILRESESSAHGALGSFYYCDACDSGALDVTGHEVGCVAEALRSALALPAAEPEPSLVEEMRDACRENIDNHEAAGDACARVAQRAIDAEKDEAWSESSFFLRHMKKSKDPVMRDIAEHYPTSRAMPLPAADKPGQEVEGARDIREDLLDDVQVHLERCALEARPKGDLDEFDTPSFRLGVQLAAQEVSALRDRLAAEQAGGG